MKKQTKNAASGGNALEVKKSVEDAVSSVEIDSLLGEGYRDMVTQVRSTPLVRIRHMPFLAPCDLADIAPGCVKAMKARDCEAKCEFEWQATCPRQRTAFLPLVGPHNRGASTMHTKAFMAGDNMPGKLTKAFLMAAPAGSYLVSNIGDYPKAVFEDVVGPSVPERDAQWAEIVFVGANSRRCYVYASKEEYHALQAVHDAERAKQRALLAAKYAPLTGQ